MSKHNAGTRQAVRIFAVLLGVTLLAYLIVRAGPSTVIHQVKSIGWGLAVIIVLGGVNYLIRTYAWRLTFLSDTSRVSLGRLFALRLGSEAAGNLGLPGQVLGDAMRVSLLGAAVPVADSLSSVALDRGLYIFTSMMVNVTGLVAAVVLMSSSGAWRVYALLFAIVLAVLLVTAAIAIRGRWPVFSGAANAIGHLPGLKKRIERKQSVINSAEEHFLSFYHDRPASFWASLVLNLACHCLAVLEVYLLLRLMNARISIVGAFVIEALTKLINVIGALNPGNVGTYEGGNVVLARLFGITGAVGLTLALCRRARTLFWAAIGAFCLIFMSRPAKKSEQDSDGGNGPAVIILTNTTPTDSGFIPPLAQVGALPVLLRDILTAQTLQPSRIIVCVASSNAEAIRDGLRGTRRLPQMVEWRAAEDSNLASLMREVASTADRVVLILGNRTYKPALLKDITEWKETSGALALTTARELVGIYGLSQAATLEYANEYDGEITTLEDLHHWMESRDLVVTQEVPSDSWQNITTPADRLAAEHKLDSWLVKPTDGRFARMNRRVSIPISRQLIKFPITPNMVSLFVFAVGLASGFFFACGGYWNMLLGAVLSVWASILDGCDGEVARMKLQSSELGCWIDTICDYIYYLVVFAGLTLGLNRSSGTNAYLTWGAFLMIGAALSFLVLGFLRRRMAGNRPETFLAVWQKEAERGSSNPLLYFGRHCEFIVRRCFFPDAILVFCMLNVMNIAFLVAAIGANLVWIIASYSWFRSSMNRGRSSACSATQIAFQAPLDEVRRAA